ncbi:hypothetical protein HYX18_01395 [Candidatus Woesearchaeota archaeon]|nr:hypothetical protein [Candidatus Woesearchaeota archaeon]
MISLKSKVREWGNSFGLVISKDKAKEFGLKPGDSVEIILKKEENILGKVFGTLKFKKSTKRMMRESDKELYNE